MPILLWGPGEPCAGQNERVVALMGVESETLASETRAVNSYPDSLRRLADIYHRLLSEDGLESLLERIADVVQELVPYDTLTIYQADEAQRVLVPVIARDRWTAEIMKTRPAFGMGITGWAVENREPVLSNEAHLDERVTFVPGTPLEPEALMSVPLIARRSVKGALNIYRQGGTVFTDEEFDLAQRFGDAVALAIDNAQTRAALKHQAQTDSLTSLYNHRFFQERLRSELNRASRARDSVALLLFDIDDFKRINDVHGHATGDQVLIALSDVLRTTVRASDVPCRIGGEEFAVILPSCDVADAVGLARRLRDRLAVTDVAPAGHITISVGLAQYPSDALKHRELVACADSAMMTAKARGKDRSVVFNEGQGERPAVKRTLQRDARSISHLKMLQSLAGKLNRINDVKQIGNTIATELATLIEYHDCRVYITEDTDLIPIAFKGEDLLASEKDTIDALRAKVGEGITGKAAATGRSLLISNAIDCEYAVHIPCTEQVDESIIAVPMLYGSRVNGVVVMSKLGVDQFDEDDVRLLEVLGGQASVALENARLYEAQRQEAENARALLEFAERLSEASSFHEVADITARETARLAEVKQVSLWLFNEVGNVYGCVAHEGYVDDIEARPLVRRFFTEDEAQALVGERREPFVLTPTVVAQKVPRFADVRLRTLAIVPLQADGIVKGWIAVRQPREEVLHFTKERLRLLKGVSYQTSVALQKAWLYKEQKEAAEVANSLLGFSHELARTEGHDAILNRTVELAARLVGSPKTSLWLQEPETGDVVVESLWGFEGKAREHLLDVRLPSADISPLLERDEPFIVREQDYRSIPNVSTFAGGFTYAVAPLVLDSGRYGALIAAAPALGAYQFSERKMRLLAGIADQAKLAINNAGNYESLETTFLSTVEALANALEAKDEYTSSHTRSIVDMSLDVGGEMGLDQSASKRLELGALFHDIGKIGIPSQILAKPGPLDDKEFEIIKTHPELGERILEPIERLAMVRPIVRHCHEHFDGTGYPDGLVGEAIPLESRIILVCDAFHAMTTDRPYRARLTTAEACNRLREAAGSQFDPQVVGIFLRLLRIRPTFALEMP